MFFSFEVHSDTMSYFWWTLFFISILGSTLVFTQALAYADSQPLPSQSVNSSIQGYARPPNMPYYYSKENGADLEIKATAYNPINLYGNVTEPNGTIHQMSTITSDKGMTELRFYASVSDPNGVYVARFQLIKGFETSDLTVTGTSTNYQKPTSHSALQMSQISPLKQIADGVLPENVVCAYGLVLVEKTPEHSVACVRPQTAEKLVERGWKITVTSSNSSLTPTSCLTDQMMVNGQCVTSIPTITPVQVCNGNMLIPYSYALPCIRPNPACPSGMTYSNGVCTAWGYTPPSPPTQQQCNSNTGECTSVGYAVMSCSGGSSSGVICEPNSMPCPTGLQVDPHGTNCNYSPSKCSTGYDIIQLSAGSYSCQPTNPPPLSNATTYLVGQKIGAFTISIINQYNVTGYYNNPYPIERPGLGDFTIMHVGDTLNPTCDGSAPLVIIAINYPNSITVSIGESIGKPYGGCPR